MGPTVRNPLGRAARHAHIVRLELARASVSYLANPGEIKTMERELAPPLPPEAASGRSRRDFLRSAGLAGVTLVIPGVLAACADTLTPDPVSPSFSKATDNPSFSRPGAVVLNFKDDIGVLNYAYALEQLEAAFYIRVLATPYAGLGGHELLLLTDVRDHEVVHRDFLKAALGTKRIPDLDVDFSSIDFNSRTSVLQTAKAFEDLGVGAYNGAAKYLDNTDYLVVAGKIVSVEARHAAAIRDLLDVPRTIGMRSFAPSAFDPAYDPNFVISQADAYITTKIVVVNT